MSKPNLDRAALERGITTYEQEQAAREEARKAERARKIAAYVLYNVEHGRTDVPAKTRRGPTFFVMPDLGGVKTPMIQQHLSDHGITIDTYSTYKGADDWEDRVAVTKVGNTRVRPSVEYAFELELRAARATAEAKAGRVETNASGPVFVAQTGKYVRWIGTREYSTNASPETAVPFRRFASDEAYAEALSTKVIQCVDLMVHDRERDTVLIGTRQQEPHAGDWVIGGGMRAGEAVADAAHRNMLRELHMHIDDNKLTPVGNYKFIWDTRAQSITHNEAGEEVRGCHMSSTLVEYPLHEEDVDLERFNEEYSHVAWVPTQDILDAPEGRYHPCLVDMVTDLRTSTGR